MKNMINRSPLLLFSVNIIFPLCALIGVIFGYNFILYNYLVTLFVITGLNLITTVILFSSKIVLNNLNTVISAFLLPASVLNGLFFSSCNQKGILLFSLICCVSAGLIFAKFAKASVLKVVMGVISALLMILLLFFTLLTYIFGEFALNTKVRTLYSPQNTYVAEIIDNDQGTLGGATFVNVTNESKHIRLLFCEFSKIPIRIYTGKWGEAGTIIIHWDDETTLAVNGIKYHIDKTPE